MSRRSRVGAGDRTAPHFFGQDHGHGWLTPAAIEQHMVEGITTTQRRFHRNAQHLLELALADVVVQALGPKLSSGRLTFFRRWLRSTSASGRRGCDRPEETTPCGQGNETWIGSEDAAAAMAKGGAKK